ncbi:fibronectin type III domain-containing protein [Flammeovirgaceae bacterium SG7u.111]|nr:fibronectin type III domain-containing protein [Flammeovirgaceae bacterium SG7u.132]WPO36050.1 fibronectin type III domain-containing protein [Flammeovirgaceae bacterium SG7u.111]
MKKLFIPLFLLLYSSFAYAQNEVRSINIDPNSGHKIDVGSSGFNVRIADKVWSYTHPDLREAVHELQPGWLRYFSGTMGDAFNSATGQYDLDYAMMFDKSKQYLTGYEFTDVKGPHRITDLYQLLGEINGKLIVTVNAFSESPTITRELARFVKNNHIEVEAWQFCNEPYFYVPHRERYWWNSGYDYAQKMKPHADAILEVFPEAKLALNFTWDGIWGFMKEINLYQKEHGAFWNTFSKHSYAPHTGKKQTIEEAYKRANTKLLEATDKYAMEEIEAYTAEGIPMIITEFGVWNKPLNGIYSSVYHIEYVMRQLQHPNTRFVGAHEVSSKYSPKENFNQLIRDAFEKGEKLDTDSIRTGINRTLEGKAYKIFHEATNNSNFIYNTQIENGFKVDGMKGSQVDGNFAQAYRGINGFDYLVVTNRSTNSTSFELTLGGKPLKKELQIEYISAETLDTKNTDIKTEIGKEGKILVRPLSLTVVKWKSDTKPLIQSPRIYDLKVMENGVKAIWGKQNGVETYQIHYGKDSKKLKQKTSVVKGNEVEISGLEKGKTYYFQLKATNSYGELSYSTILSLDFSLPQSPRIFKTARRNNTATIMWESVAGAEGYLLKYVQENGKEVIVDTKNVFGYRVKDLQMDTNYAFSVAAYNGLGQSAFSADEEIILKKDIPYSPRNVSAKEMTNGDIKINWIAQKQNPPQTKYTVYRGAKLHEFEVLAENVEQEFYIDSSTEKGKQYFYTVKAKTEAGESNFYPNIATPLKANKGYSIEITSTKKDAKGDFIIDVAFKNILLDGEYSYGIVYSNISFLNVEEARVEGKALNTNSGTFQVILPKNKLQSKARFAIKAFVNTNGKDLFSPDSENIIQAD